MILLLACTGPTVPPDAPAEAPAESPSVEATPASWPDGVRVDTAPFVRAGTAQGHAVVNDVSVYGWGDGGLVWEQHHPGLGGASCDMWSELQQVGAGGVVETLRFDHPEVEADECAGPAPREALAAEREAWLAARGPVAGGVGLGGSALTLTGEHREPMEFDSKAGYELTVAGQRVEREARDFHWGWELVQVFWHPQGTQAAALVAGTGMGFEGSYTWYEVQIVTLPGDAEPQ